VQQVPPQSARVIPLMRHAKPVETVSVEGERCEHEHVSEAGYCCDCGAQVEAEAAVGD
jgi:hypothetical protein